MLLKLLESEPTVKQWATDKLRITDLKHGAPAVKQMHKISAPSFSARHFLAGRFNNSDAFPDASVSVGQRLIHMHKFVVASGNEVLAKRWDPMWEGNQQTLDTFLSCDKCSIKPSHITAVMFFEFFYTCKVSWPEGTPDMVSALQLLVMASVCDVPYLVCEAEVALKRGVTIDNCCKLLEVADHHAADQLQKFCLNYIANGHKLVSKAEGYASLSPELIRKVEQAIQTLQHSA